MRSKIIIAIISSIAGILFLSGLTAAENTSQRNIAAAQVNCPPPEELAAMQAELDSLFIQTEAIRAYNDATTNQLAGTNETLYSFRSQLEHGRTTRQTLLEERSEILKDVSLSTEEHKRLDEIQQELAALAVLMSGANTREEEQRDITSILWRPVVDQNETRSVSIERYERFTQRILEVDLGAAVADIEDLAALLDQYSPCLQAAPLDNTTAPAVDSDGNPVIVPSETAVPPVPPIVNPTLPGTPDVTETTMPTEIPPTAVIEPTIPPEPTATIPSDDGDRSKVVICHRPPGNPDNMHTIEVGAAAVPAHMAHGDTMGACPNGR